MADRYWVGGTGNWSDTDHWSTESGGDGGADVPTSSDDVFIDENSGFGGGGTIQIEEAVCHDLTCTSGHTYTFAGGYDFEVYGSISLEAGVTVTENAGGFVLLSTDAETINAPNEYMGFLYIDGTGSWQLLSDISLSETEIGGYYQQNGTFDANDHNVTADRFFFYADTDYTPTVIMGSGTWEVTGEEGDFTIEQGSNEVVTIVPETSTIKLTGDWAYLDFYDNEENETGKTFNNLWIVGTDGTTIIGGSNTFNDFKVTNPPQEIKFYEGTTQTVTTFTVSGTSENTISIDSINELGEPSETQHTLSCASGTISCDYLDISNSNATGGATWNAFITNGNINSGNNTGWIFDGAKSLSDSFSLTNGGGAKSVGLAKADNFSLTDGGETKAIGKAVLDSFAMTDLEIKAISIPKADTLALSDLPSKQPQLPKADTFALADTIGGKGIGKSSNDTFAMTDLGWSYYSPSEQPSIKVKEGVPIINAKVED